MIFFILVIILIVVMIIGIIYFYQKNLKTINQLTAQFDQLKEDNLDTILDQIADLKLTGASLDHFQKDRSAYQASKGQIIDLQTQLISISEKNASFRVFTAWHQLKHLTQILTEQKQKLLTANKGLKQLFQSIQQNQTTLKDLQTKVQQQQQLLNDREELADLVVPLSEQLTQIMTQFALIEDKINQGDALAAQQDLQQIKAALANYQQQLQQVQQRLKIDYSEQLKELQAAEKKMQFTSIKMTDPQISTELKDIKQLLQQMHLLLVKLNFDEFDQLNQQVQDKIDYLYHRITQEWRDKRKVQRNQPVVGDFIRHAERQNRLLKQKINQLLDEYVVNEGERQLANSYSQKIAQIKTEYQKQLKLIRDEQAIFSQVWQQLQQLNQQLQDIEQQQIKIEQNLDGLVDGRSVATNSYQEFTIKLDHLQRQVAVLHLPGTSKDYQKYSAMVTKEVNKVGKMLKQLPIDVEELTKQLFVTQEDLNNFEQLTQQLLADVQITGRLLQYANRYVATVPEVKTAAQKAQMQYDQEFDYHQAVQTIATALEKVEPGAVQRIEDLYYSDYPQKS